MCSPDLRGERRAVSSGKTLSSFVRSAVHVVDSLRAHLPSLFDQRVFPTTPGVLRCVCLSFLFVHASSRAHYALHALSRSRGVLSSRFRRYPASIVFLYQPPLFYQRSPLSLCLCPAMARTFSPFLFHPIHPRLVHFLDLSSSRFNHRASVSASRTLSAIVFLSPSQTAECLTSTSLFAPRLLSPTNRSLPPSITLSMPPLPLSLFLPLAVSHQLTHTLRRRQAPVPCGLVLRARGCCEIIVSPRPSRNQPPRVTPRRGKQQ